MKQTSTKFEYILPHRIDVARKVQIGLRATGEPIYSMATVHTGIICKQEHIDIAEEFRGKEVPAKMGFRLDRFFTMPHLDIRKNDFIYSPFTGGSQTTVTDIHYAVGLTTLRYVEYITETI